MLHFLSCEVTYDNECLKWTRVRTLRVSVRRLGSCGAAGTLNIPAASETLQTHVRAADSTWEDIMGCYMNIVSLGFMIDVCDHESFQSI